MRRTSGAVAPVVRTGIHRVRTVATSSRAIEVSAPQVNRRRPDEATGERLRFPSKILPPWCRKSPRATEALPALNLHRLPSGDSMLALKAVPRFGGRAVRTHRDPADRAVAGLPPRLSGPRPVGQRPGYVWVDGVHPKVRPGQAYSCIPVVMGVRMDGTKELVALAQGLSESTES
ncbi:hypothetical protein [Streptomyces sp. NPDC053720]|uniref:hypothetical protein n=1 Tax=Streptomyces sp. NPDC053720 TaxID=3154855 RepID=UPI00343E8E52